MMITLIIVCTMAGAPGSAKKNANMRKKAPITIKKYAAICPTKMIPLMTNRTPLITKLKNPVITHPMYVSVSAPKHSLSAAMITVISMNEKSNPVVGSVGLNNNRPFEKFPA